jgi:hypothetical protein
MRKESKGGDIDGKGNLGLFWVYRVNGLVGEELVCS